MGAYVHEFLEHRALENAQNSASVYYTVRIMTWREQQNQNLELLEVDEILWYLSIHFLLRNGLSFITDWVTRDCPEMVNDIQ